MREKNYSLSLGLVITGAVVAHADVALLLSLL